MDAEITNAETGSVLTLAEPHFDDEATLLSARRVVPLEEVSSFGSGKAARLARRWMFAAIVLGSLLLGVVGGAAYYSYLNREAAHAFVNLESITSGVDAMAIEPTQNNDAGMPTNAPEAAASLPQPAASPNETRKPTAQRIDVLTFPSTPEEMQAREERQARKEARKRIRELERESRNPKSRNDLTRIRDIFEGPQKP
jgi:hypothetical protein